MQREFTFAVIPQGEAEYSPSVELFACPYARSTRRVRRASPTATLRCPCFAAAQPLPLLCAILLRSRSSRYVRVSALATVLLAHVVAFGACTSPSRTAVRCDFLSQCRANLLRIKIRPMCQHRRRRARRRQDHLRPAPDRLDSDCPYSLYIECLPFSVGRAVRMSLCSPGIGGPEARLRSAFRTLRLSPSSSLPLPVARCATPVAAFSIKVPLVS
jgi:hypothetical protein